MQWLTGDGWEAGRRGTRGQREMMDLFVSVIVVTVSQVFP